MLTNIDSSANLAVKNLDTARRFYEEILGLKQVDSQDGEVIVYRSGKTLLNVYRSQFAGTNKATAVTWTVGNEIEKIAAALKARGVQFEHYTDMPNTTIDGDIHVMGPMKVAWFKDPDGNILNLING